MYIVLCTSKNKDMINAMREAIKEKFPTAKFSTQELEHRGFQLKLEGSHDETLPNMFAEGFAAAWNSFTKKA